MNDKIEHFHSEECASTQTSLKEFIQENPHEENILFSTLFQTLGRGRSGNGWESLDNSLAMSFKIRPNEVMTLTSLELGILICQFFESHKLSLKWPNDLLTVEGLKCGGILCQGYNQNILVGVGLNLGKSEEIRPNSNFKFGRSCIDSNLVLKSSQIKEYCSKLYSFIIHNRLSSKEVREKWASYSIHLNKSVLIKDQTIEERGVFIGIGESGEALLNQKGLIKKIYTGSLFLD
ncbi:biotin--[acetyl-CoA-carboxylase] ligase [Halobacteriovorax marinus]|uniref:Biotin--[acetyl-CoA-carboxylase] ligase n=1 Tax=Halobacteriovorax marinus TaxID=97084 RepID=A0A1Y5F2N1_9BACT|nr:biotin--[acetyl-CoA-carboxylase] ligase [Halobacteriovorax marinus]